MACLVCAIATCDSALLTTMTSEYNDRMCCGSTNDLDSITTCMPSNLLTLNRSTKDSLP
jgi:hypothetical protein